MFYFRQFLADPDIFSLCQDHCTV